MTTVEEPDVAETREDIPLKRGKRSTGWYVCSEECFSGFRFVVVAFGTLTFVITVALLVQIYYGDYQIVPHGSVSTDNLECSKIGTSVLKQGGNAVDAAIAGAFCLAVAAPHVTGLDAEGHMILYNHRTRFPPNVIDFTGPLTVPDNIPRLVLGLAFAHQQYGSLAWKDLVQPSAELAERGYLISKQLVQAVTRSKAEHLYGRLEPGQILRLENLSKTLYRIADIPENELYTFIQRKQPVLSQALKSSFNNYDVYVPNTPIGPALVSNLKKMESFNFTEKDTAKPEYTYRLVEATQDTYAEYNISDRFHEGTSSNVAVIDMNDNYVSLVTGMFQFFGSGELNDNGYVLDVANKDKPCSRMPFIVIDGSFICGRRIVLGAGNLAVATELVTTLLVAKENATEGIEAPRFYVLGNGTLGVEGSHLPSFNEDVISYLKTLTPNILPVPEPYPSSNIVEKFKDDLSSHSDSRGGGIASRF